MVNDDILSMPDKWEYPWYAAWDLAFHALALSVVDLDFAKQQLGMMLRDGIFIPTARFRLMNGISATLILPCMRGRRFSCIAPR